MSYARGTEHYNLPQTVGTDKRDWFDTNKSFEDIDADLYSAKQTADSAASGITSLTTRIGIAEGDITALETRVGTAEGNISALQGSVTGLGNDLADVKSDLRDAICSVVEPDATADYRHEVDTYFWYNDTLYITTVTIAVGDTIVPNTNCNTTNITSEIVKTLNDIGDISELTTDNKNSVVDAINELTNYLTVKEINFTGVHSSVATIEGKEISGVKNVHVIANNIPTGTWTTLAIISDYKPTIKQVFTAISGTGTHFAEVAISTAGGITIFAPVGDSFEFNWTYI